MQRLGQHFGARKTPQNEPIPGRNMTQNDAGGYVFALDKWGRLERFLILGTEGGTYYVGEKKLSKDNALNVLECIKEDGGRVVRRVVEVSDGGKAAKNDYALFVLALVTTYGDEAARKDAYASLPKVARIGSHLFLFLNYVESMRGWSRGLRTAVGKWYTDKEPKDLAYQLTKYRQRYGFSHRDALRLAHPKAPTPDHDALFRYATTGNYEEVGQDAETWAYMTALASLAGSNEKNAAALIAENRLPREVVPTEMLNNPVVWTALLGEDGRRMPMTALIRNLGNLTKLGVLKPMNGLSRAVAERLTDGEALKRARIHPIAVFAAYLTYRSGSGYRGSGEWVPVAEIVDALERAFYLSFENVEPTNKRVIYAVDVSGSMTGSYYGGTVAGVPGLSPAIGAGALALMCAATERSYAVWGFDHNLYSLPITKSSSLNDAIAAASRHGGATDASLPFRGALQQGIEVDAFVLLTDSETWYGDRHPVQALVEYRRQSGIASKLVVVGMTATGSTLGDPQDGGVLDVVGFSTDTPRLINQFIAA